MCIVVPSLKASRGLHSKLKDEREEERGVLALSSERGIAHPAFRFASRSHRAWNFLEQSVLESRHAERPTTRHLTMVLLEEVEDEDFVLTGNKETEDDDEFTDTGLSKIPR